MKIKIIEFSFSFRLEHFKFYFHLYAWNNANEASTLKTLKQY